MNTYLYQVNMLTIYNIHDYKSKSIDKLYYKYIKFCLTKCLIIYIY